MDIIGAADKNENVHSIICVKPNNISHLKSTGTGLEARVQCSTINFCFNNLYLLLLGSNSTHKC